MVSLTFCAFHFDKHFLISLSQPQLVPGRSYLSLCFVDTEQWQPLCGCFTNLNVEKKKKKRMEYLIAFYNGSEISVIIYYQMWLLKALGVAGILHEFQLGPVIESRIHLAGQSNRFYCACFTHTSTVAQQHRTKKRTCHTATRGHGIANACGISKNPKLIWEKRRTKKVELLVREF